MGKIPNAVEVFRPPTFASSPWMALQPTLFKQVEANQPSMFCVATEGGHHLVDGLVAVLLNMLEDPPPPSEGYSIRAIALLKPGEPWAFLLDSTQKAPTGTPGLRLTFWTKIGSRLDASTGPVSSNATPKTLPWLG